MLVLALAFSVLFTGKTMRVDYFHTGDHGREIVAVDRIVADGPWAGSTTRLLDDLNLGSYLFEVVDPDTNRTLYSRGFAMSPAVTTEFPKDQPEPWEPNVTALRDPSKLKWKDLVAAETPPRIDREEGAGVGVRRALHRATGLRYADALRHGELGEGRRLRRRGVPGEGALPAADRLHHVHARRGGILQGLPQGDRESDRPVRDSGYGRLFESSRNLIRSLFAGPAVAGWK